MADTQKTKADTKAKKPSLASLEKKHKKLEALVLKLAHYKGLDHIVKEFQYEPWVPSKKDMQRWDDFKE